MKKNNSSAKPMIQLGFLSIWVLLGLGLINVVGANLMDTDTSRKTGKDNSSKKRKNRIEKNIAGGEENSGKRPPAGSKNNSVKLSEKYYRSMSMSAIDQRFILEKPIAKMTEPERAQVHRELERLLERKGIQQFLTIIQIAEGGEPNIIVGDKPGCRVSDLKKHPADALPSSCYYYYYDKKGRLVFSTASGNYQITRTNFRKYAPFLDITDFEVKSQQMIALAIIRDGGRKPEQGKDGFRDLVHGDVRSGTKKATSDWAAMPGSDLPGRKYQGFDKMQESVINGTYRQPARRLANRKNVKNVQITKRRIPARQNPAQRASGA